MTAFLNQVPYKEVFAMTEKTPVEVNEECAAEIAACMTRRIGKKRRM
jgi:hypothetical protein